MTDHVSTPSALLELEAERIYHAIFHGPIPDVVKRRFVDVAPRLNRKADSDTLEAYYRMIETAGDLEAIEVAARYTRTKAHLTSKFHMMVYLAETLPENQHHFINTRSSVVGGWLAFLGGGTRTVYKLAKGVLLQTRMPRA